MLKVFVTAYQTAKNWSKKNINFFGKIPIIPNFADQQRLRLAIAQLEQKNLEISLAIFDDLAQIAQANPKFHWQIMEALTNFVRNNAPNLPQEQIKSSSLLTIRADIQAALTVIASRNAQQDLKNELLDLSHTNISGAKLPGANLERTNLDKTNLSGTNLCNANLQGAILTAANLAGANLSGANLQEAILSSAILSGANLSRANLQRASLLSAKLNGAILKDAIIDGANFRDAEFYEG